MARLDLDWVHVLSAAQVDLLASTDESKPAAVVRSVTPRGPTWRNSKPVGRRSALIEVPPAQVSRARNHRLRACIMRALVDTCELRKREMT